MQVLEWKFRGAGSPQPVSPETQNSILPNGFVTWMKSKATPYGIELVLPGELDANHLGGIGALWLTPHLPIGGIASPGSLNLTGGRIEIDARLGPNFEANGNRWTVLACSNYGPPATPKMDPNQTTNWAMAGDLFLQLNKSGFATAVLDISASEPDWTYAEYDYGYLPLISGKYAKFPFAGTVANVNQTLHFPIIGPRPDRPPTGTIIIDAIRVTCYGTTTPAVSLAYAQSLTGLDRYRAMCAHARVGNAVAQAEIGQWVWNGVGGGGYYPDLVDMKMALEYLNPLTTTDEAAALTVAHMRCQGKGSAPQEFATARTILQQWPTRPASRFRLGIMKMKGWGELDVTGGLIDLEYAANHSHNGVPIVSAMAEVGRHYHDVLGDFYNAYIFLARAKKFAVGDNVLGPEAMQKINDNLAVAAVSATVAGYPPTLLQAAFVDPWSPSAV